MALRTVRALDVVESRPPLRPQPTGIAPVLNMRGVKVGLGPLQPGLLDIHERWLNDFDLLAMLDRRFRPLTADWIRAWYEPQSRATGDALVFTIWDLASMTPIGNAARQDIDPRTRTAEFGIFISDPAWRGDGRGTEATRILLRFAFETLSLENVMFRVYACNERALRVYERVGFQTIGRRRGAQRRWGQAWDTILMDITPAEFVARNGQAIGADVVLRRQRGIGAVPPAPNRGRGSVPVRRLVDRRVRTHTAAPGSRALSSARGDFRFGVREAATPVASRRRSARRPGAASAAASRG